MKKRIFKIAKWAVIIAATYFVATTIFFGYDDIDTQKGIYHFYWSGLNGLWKKDKPFGFRRNEPMPTRLDGIDGPYVFGNDVYTVSQDSRLIRQQLDSSRTIAVSTGSDLLTQFPVSLAPAYPTEAEEYAAPGKLIAISDIEGNFTALYSFLLSNRVIDKDGNWTFGQGHLVFNGDFFDRGSEVTQVLWLIYRLDRQALQYGGKVHFILGNHDIMNLYGDASYKEFKYIAVAKQISGQPHWDAALKYLYSETSELGKWLRSKNIIEKIGDYIFVHGGLNIDHCNGRYTIHELNTTARKYYGTLTTNDALSSERDLPVVSSINSPYWDRRLHFDWKYRSMLFLNRIRVKETTQQELDKILRFYKASRIVIGHSIVGNVKTAYDHKVIKIDVKHGQQMHSGQTRGLLIKEGVAFQVDDRGNSERLPQAGPAIRH